MGSGQNEGLNLQTLPNTRNKYQIYYLILFIFHISVTSFSGMRTVSYNSWIETERTILDKVLSNERSTAFAATINVINSYLLDCKECNWYKSRETILSEAR